MHCWRAFLLRLFGAKVGRPVYIYPSSKVWAPWNLEIGDFSTLADGVDCYSVDKVTIGSFTTISQNCFLCTAGHDYLNPSILLRPQMDLITAPITLGNHVWLTANVYVSPGINVQDGVVVMANSSVIKHIPAWTVVAGNPAKFIKRRILR